MLASDIPSDVWIIISSHVVNPKNHITLSQICRSSRALYLGEEKWRHLCRSIGVGKPLVDKRSWQAVFFGVVKHRRRCRVPSCYQFGLPPTTAVGDLLSTPHEVIEHLTYFRREFPCTCGGHHSDDEDEDEDEDDDENDSEDDIDATDSDVSSDEDEDEEEEENEWEDYINTEAMELFPNATSQAMAMLLKESFMTMMGAPSTTISNATFPKPKVDSIPVPAPEPKRKGNILPLSWMNRALVPRKPTLHPFLLELGSVQFQRFLSARMALQPGMSIEAPGTTTAEGMDWDDEVNVRGEKRNASMVDIMNHVLLSRAFATNPPVAELKIELESRAIHTKITNPDGVTILDVIHQLRSYLKEPLSTEETAILCAAHPHPDCHLNRFKTRLGYTLRNYPLPVQIPGQPKNGVMECWLKGALRFVKGEVICDLVPRQGVDQLALGVLSGLF